MENTIYDQLGEENLQQLVNKFYELVVGNPILSPLFNTDMELVRAKQTAFLTQFFGGPGKYNQTYGRPMMRARHMPHKITEEAAVEWLNCMNSAIKTLDISVDLKNSLFKAFPRLAAHMVNS